MGQAERDRRLASSAIGEYTSDTVTVHVSVDVKANDVLRFVATMSSRCRMSERSERSQSWRVKTVPDGADVPDQRRYMSEKDRMLPPARRHQSSRVNRGEADLLAAVTCYVSRSCCS